MKYLVIFFILLFLSSCSDDTINNNGTSNPVADFDLYYTKFITSRRKVECYTIKSDGSNRRLLNDSIGVTSHSFYNRVSLAGIDTNGYFLTPLYTANSDGTNLKKIPSDGYYPAYFILSPKGDKVLYTTDEGNYLIVVNADGTGLVQVSDGIRGTEQIPKFSPDGKQIAFFEAPSSLQTGLYISNTTGTYKKLLKDSIFYSNGFTLDWSPDGSKIVYQNRKGNGNEAKICIIDTSGAYYVVLNAGYNPDWSPNGDKICFLNYINSGPLDIFIMDNDGNNIINLTNTSSFNEYEPVWASDNHRIMYSNSSGKVSIFDTDQMSSHIVIDSVYWPYWKY